MLKISTIEPLSEYNLKVLFENGEVKICNISQFMDKGAFKELMDDALFKGMKNTGFSVEWPNEIDLSADKLYAIGE